MEFEVLSAGIAQVNVIDPERRKGTVDLGILELRAWPDIRILLARPLKN